MKKMMLIGGGVVALLLATAGGVFFVMKGDPPPEDGAEPEMAAAREVFYYNIKPEFVVNLNGKGREKFMMVELSVATYDEKVTAVIDDHMPELRNDLFMVLGEQDAGNLNTVAGKNTLREQALATITEVVTNHYAEGSVEDVYLTRLVLQ